MRQPIIQRDSRHDLENTYAYCAITGKQKKGLHSYEFPNLIRKCDIDSITKIGKKSYSNYKSLIKTKLKIHSPYYINISNIES